jgi:hypothetical protein
LTPGELYLMVMALPAMVAVTVAGGLFGGAFGTLGGGAGWADRAATATNRLAQTKRRFMMVFSSGQRGFGCTALT